MDSCGGRVLKRYAPDDEAYDLRAASPATSPPSRPSERAAKDSSPAQSREQAFCIGAGQVHADYQPLASSAVRLDRMARGDIYRDASSSHFSTAADLGAAWGRAAARQSAATEQERAVLASDEALVDGVIEEREQPSK